jgi:hypothetical protein
MADFGWRGNRVELLISLYLQNLCFLNLGFGGWGGQPFGSSLPWARPWPQWINGIRLFRQIIVVSSSTVEMEITCYSLNNHEIIPRTRAHCFRVPLGTRTLLAPCLASLTGGGGGCPRAQRLIGRDAESQYRLIISPLVTLCRPPTVRVRCRGHLKYLTNCPDHQVRIINPLNTKRICFIYEDPVRTAQ